MDINKRKIKEKFAKFATYNVLRILRRFVSKRENIWIFGAWHGELFTGNPKYFYLFITGNCSNVIPVWLTKSKDVYKEIKEISGNVYLQNTFKALYYGLLGKVYIFNIGIDDVIHYSLYNAKIINLSHGMVLKKLTTDKREVTNYSLLRRLERKVVSKLTSSKIDGSMIDLHIATSESTKKNLYKIFPCPNFKITGQPRDDIFYVNLKKDIILNKIGLGEYKNKIIVSYLPTFRDQISSYNSITGSDNKIINNFFEYNPNVVILEKSHYNEKSSANKIHFHHTNYKNLSKTKIDTQELLYVTDILITDYSGVFIDFLHLNRPIIFYPFDFEEYNKTRGIFYNYEKIACGRIVYNLKNLLNAILDYIENPNLDKEKRKAVKKLFHNFTDGKSCQRVYNEIISIIS